MLSFFGGRGLLRQVSVPKLDGLARRAHEPSLQNASAIALVEGMVADESIINR